MCRQCPGYRQEVSQLLFATGSNYWLPGLPAPPPLPPPPKPVTEEDSAKPTGEQPSTSSDVASGDHEWRLDIRVWTFTHTVAAYWFNPATSKTLLFGLPRLNLLLQPSSVLSAAPQEYRCPPQGCHLICTCCLQPMPDRRAELNPQQAQQCEWSLKVLSGRQCCCRLNVRLSMIKTFIVQCLSCSYLIMLALTFLIVPVFLVTSVEDVCFMGFFVCWLSLLYFFLLFAGIDTVNSVVCLMCMMCCVLAGVLCQRPFCHMYWGCQRTGCQGCLARFSGMYLFQQNSPGISAAGLVVGLCHSANGAHRSPRCCRSEKSSHKKCAVSDVACQCTHRFVCWGLSLSSSFTFRAQSDRQMPGWCAEQQQLWIRGPPGESDSPRVDTPTLGGSLWAHNKVLLVWSGVHRMQFMSTVVCCLCCPKHLHSWKSEVVICVPLISLCCPQPNSPGFLSVWNSPVVMCVHPSTRTTCPPEGSHGEIYGRKLCRAWSRATIIWQVRLPV